MAKWQNGAGRVTIPQKCRERLRKVGEARSTELIFEESPSVRRPPHFIAMSQSGNSEQKGEGGTRTWFLRILSQLRFR